MIQYFLKKAKEGQPVYINNVYEKFFELPENERSIIYCNISRLEKDSSQLFKIAVPIISSDDKEGMDFLKSYVYAEIYNILSGLGGRLATIYIDTSKKQIFDIVSGINDAFCINKIRSERKGYGKCINVLDRMLEALYPGEAYFSLEIKDISEFAVAEESTDNNGISGYADIEAIQKKLGDKAVIGMDVGGTDIKAILVKNGRIQCFKEYDWFPAEFSLTRQLVDPICFIVRLLILKLYANEHSLETDLLKKIDQALEKNATEDFIKNVVEEVENITGDSLKIDAIGLCFPDVVVKNKIVGGEVYKTRGIRNNKEINYEEDFRQLTDLDKKLERHIKKGGTLKIINDGPMAAFTAAVEIGLSKDSGKIKKGVFAHTLGTELGTGWVRNDLTIPDIPLEVYNFIIDLGSFVEKAYEPDDLRSINNFNTGLAGTLQKYCSQSGIFRLAMKYFPSERPDLLKELFDKGFIVERKVNGRNGLYFATEPQDMRKPFLEFMMMLPDREKDETNKKIWREVGEFLAVTGLETEKILNPKTNIRFLFGRVVKNQTCFNLICEGAERISRDFKFIVAGTDIANSSLMKELEKSNKFTVAQFGQAVGAVYFAL